MKGHKQRGRWKELKQTWMEVILSFLWYTKSKQVYCGLLGNEMFMPPLNESMRNRLGVSQVLDG